MIIGDKVRVILPQYETYPFQIGEEFTVGDVQVSELTGDIHIWAEGFDDYSYYEDELEIVKE